MQTYFSWEEASRLTRRESPTQTGVLTQSIRNPKDSGHTLPDGSGKYVYRGLHIYVDPNGLMSPSSNPHNWGNVYAIPSLVD